MRTVIYAVVAASSVMLGCYDQEAVDREAAELGLSDEEIEAVVDALLDARLADYDARLTALEAGMGIPYAGDTD